LNPNLFWREWSSSYKRYNRLRINSEYFQLNSHYTEITMGKKIVLVDHSINYSITIFIIDTRTCWISIRVKTLSSITLILCWTHRETSTDCTCFHKEWNCWIWAYWISWKWLRFRSCWRRMCKDSIISFISVSIWIKSWSVRTSIMIFW
jgi:hypothetical protein